MEKIIGTHNTMSYLPPKHWWQNPINWLFAQCQKGITEDVKEQAVDIRLVWNKKQRRWDYAHGLVKYGRHTNPSSLITYFIGTGVKYFRLILERNGGEEQFQYICMDLSRTFFDKAVFLGGYRKSDWKQLYDFGTNDIPIHQWVGSMAEDARWYERFIPRLYARRMNQKNMENLKEGINLFDFL